MPKTKEEPMMDALGREMRSDAAKTIQPKPAVEDLTVVKTGQGPEDYKYVDPTTLFALQRFVIKLLDSPAKSAVELEKRGRDGGFNPFIRETAAAVVAAGTFPPGGWVTRRVGAWEAVQGEQEQAPSSGLLSDVPGAEVLRNGQWEIAGPPEPLPESSDVVGEIHRLDGTVDVVTRTAEVWVPVFCEEDEDEL